MLILYLSCYAAVLIKCTYYAQNYTYAVELGLRLVHYCCICTNLRE